MEDLTVTEDQIRAAVSSALTELNLRAAAGAVKDVAAGVGDAVRGAKSNYDARVRQQTALAFRGELEKIIKKFQPKIEKLGGSAADVARSLRVLADRLDPAGATNPKQQQPAQQPVQQPVINSPHPGISRSQSGNPNVTGGQSIRQRQ